MANYLQWLASETETAWWHDSADPREIARGLERGAVGVTTNPVLAAACLQADPARWAAAVEGVAAGRAGRERAIAVSALVVRSAAELLRPLHDRTGGRCGWVCGQLDPSLAHDREAMRSMAERYRAFAPNVSIKFPPTAAGLAALEEACASGASVTSTVSFSVAQVLAAAEHHRRGCERARRAGVEPAPSYAVLMIGRVDDYLAEIARDRQASLEEGDLRLAGLAIGKRAYRLLRERGSELQLMVAALRGPHHMTRLCGGALVMSIHPKVQAMLLEGEPPRARGIDDPVPAAALERLRALPDFVRMFEVDGVTEADFLSLGLVQKTLTQFAQGGWAALEKA